MKGFIAKTVTVIVVTGGVLAAAGCHHYDDLVDPCWPERYAYTARNEVFDAFAPQVHNGHVLDQTVWHYLFEPGTATLTAGGRDRLAYLARRRPAPDPVLYVQSAQERIDIPYDPAAPDKFVEARNKLDGERVQAVQAYLNAITAGRHVAFQVVLHDPPETGLAGVPVQTSITARNASFQGIFTPPPRAAVR